MVVWEPEKHWGAGRSGSELSRPSSEQERLLEVAPPGGGSSEQILSTVGVLLTSVLLSRLGRQTTAGRLKVVSCALEQNRNSQLLPSYLPEVIYTQRQGREGKG